MGLDPSRNLCQFTYNFLIICLSRIFLNICLWHISGPIERVAIPKEKDGKIKTFGFVTYKHVSSVGYALSIYAGTKLFGKELLLRNRNANKGREQPQYQSPMASSSLLHGYNNPIMIGGNDFNASAMLAQRQLIQQQLLAMATGQNSLSHAAQMFTGSSNETFASTRSDTIGSQREQYVDRNRHHREENRSNRSKPYRRSRSRSPQQFRNRDHSPAESRNRDRHRRSDDRSKGNYHRWGKR